MRPDAQRFPLTWPHGWPRTKNGQRRAASFRSSDTRTIQGGSGPTVVRDSKRVSVYVSIQRLEDQLRLLGGNANTTAILSTNVPLRLDGRPRSDGEPSDPGAALYFDLKGTPISMACDRWDRVADNIVALAQHIDALRRIDRYGVGKMEQAFGGYKALPASVMQWWDILEVDSNCMLSTAEAAYFTLAKKYHPDVEGGSHEAMAKLNDAREQARKALA